MLTNIKEKLKEYVKVLAVVFIMFFAVGFVLIAAVGISLFGVATRGAVPLHNESEVVEAVCMQLPGAELLSSHIERNGSEKYGGTGEYKFRYKDIEFTFTEKNARHADFPIAGPYSNSNENDYMEKLFEKYDSKTLTQAAGREIKLDMGYYVDIACQTDSYDDIPDSAEALRCVYEMICDYIPIAAAEEYSLDIGFKRLRFGIYAPSNNVACDDINTIPFNENFGYIEVKTISEDELEYDTEELIKSVREKYRDSLNLGYVFDPVLTPDNPIDTEVDVLNNRYIYDIYIDGVLFKPGHDREYEFIYDMKSKSYMAVIDFNIYDTSMELSEEQDILYDLVNFRFENAKYASTYVDDDKLDSYSTISFNRGEDRVELIKNPSCCEKSGSINYFVNGDHYLLSTKPHINGGEYDRDYIDIYDTAELAGLSVERIDEDKSAVYFSTDIEKYPNPNDHTYEFTYSEKPELLQYLYINGAKIRKSTEPRAGSELALVYNEEDGRYYCIVSIFDFDKCIFNSCYEALYPNMTIPRAENKHIKFTVGSDEYEIYPEDEETFFLVKNGSERKLKTYGRIGKRYVYGWYDFYISVDDMAEILGLKIDRIDPKTESLYLAAKD